MGIVWGLTDMRECRQDFPGNQVRSSRARFQGIFESRIADPQKPVFPLYRPVCGRLDKEQKPTAQSGGVNPSGV